MRPLQGVRVLDLSRLLPGPFASLVLADLGATVDKLEDAESGDYLRHMPPLVDGVESGGPTSRAPAQSSMFLFLNRNKRSIVLDLKKPEGKAAFERLVPHYDVVLEQFRPGVLDRLGVGPEALRKLHPGLVVCSLSGFGQDGPLAQRAGHDIGYMARAGALAATGPEGSPPITPGVQVADIGGGLWTVIAILGALAARGRTGQGAHLDISMLEASLSFAAVSYGMLAGGVEVAGGAAPLTGGLAGYRTYATKDGRAVALGALEPKFLRAFADAAGITFDPAWLVPGPHQDAARREVAAFFAARTLDECVAFAAVGDFCLEPVLTPREAIDDAQVRARNAFFRMASPWGELLQMRLPITPSAAEHRPPPRPGEHTREILREAGFDDRDIAALGA